MLKWLYIVIRNGSSLVLGLFYRDIKKKENDFLKVAYPSLAEVSS